MARDVPGFTAMAFDKRAPVPDDVIATAERFIEFVRSTGESKPLPYQAELETAVGGALEVAKKEWAETQAALAAQQTLLADTRAAAAELQKELVAFRRTLALAIGTQSRDYRALRSKASAGKEEDESDTIEDGAGTGEQNSAVVSPSARTVPPRSNGASNGKSHAVLYASNM